LVAPSNHTLSRELVGTTSNGIEYSGIQWIQKVCDCGQHVRVRRYIPRRPPPLKSPPLKSPPLKCTPSEDLTGF